MTLAPASRVGPYEIVCLLGEGGMGEVYKARDTRLDRLVAIKFSPERFSERFDREARAIAALNHPNIRQIYDVGPDYVVMEYVDGTRPVRPDSTRQLIDLAVQIADGLAAAHAGGFVHRDLKPENVLVTPDGRVKILDFGVAKHRLRDSTAGGATRTITSTGTVVGTAAYMSPEQARGAEVDGRSDQFSLGLLLFELASGTHPFQRGSTAETMAAIIREEPPPLPTSVPAPLRWMIERCLAKDPGDRYESTRDLYRDLRTIRDHLSEASAAVSTAQPNRLTRRAWMAAGAGAAGLAAGGAGGALWRRTRATAQPLWSGVLLGGPSFALGPRISPDGQLLAFVSMVERQMQVAVMKSDASAWTVLTREKSNGSVLNLAWASDGTRLYFDRYWEKPRGVYMIPPLGGEPVLVLENAAAPLPLPDGSMVLLRSGHGVRDQMHQFWPDSGRLQALPAFVAFWRSTGAMRATADGKHIVFFRSHGDDGAPAPGLCALDLSSRRVRGLDAGVPIEYHESDPFTGAVTNDGRAVLFGRREDDMYRITSVPLGGGGVRDVMSLPASAALWHMDMAQDGALYVDQVNRPLSLLRLTERGSVLQQSPMPALGIQSILPLNEGNVLYTAVQAGRRYLMMARAGAEPRRFLSVSDENSAPFARVGQDALAFVLGSNPSARIAIASLPSGRIIRQLPFQIGELRSLTASPDGKAVYYAASDAVWSAPADGAGAPRRMSQGNYVTADPLGRCLFIKHATADGIRLVRLPVAGGDEREIRVPGNLRLSGLDFAPATVDAQGRLLIETASPDSWFYGVSVLDSERGALTPLEVPGVRGVVAASWTADGSIAALGVDLASSVWRYRRSS